MRTILLTVFLSVIITFLSAQNIDSIINVREVERIERILSSDEMQGRRTFTTAIDKAAEFIANEFKSAGLEPVSGSSYFQEFKMVRTKFLSAKGEINGKPLEEKNIVVLSGKPAISVTQSTEFEKVKVKSTDTLQSLVRRLLGKNKNYFLVVDSAHRPTFNNLKRRPTTFPLQGTVVMVLTQEDPSTYNIEFRQEVSEMSLKNVVGRLPGKKKKEEQVIFSGHYDHLGIGKPNKDGDSIFNGANDDAAGITAVIMLAKYFSALKNNERSLTFVAFTAEEMGGYGSQYFSRQIDPNKAIAMFNIEMIGTESKWGANSAFITGYEKTDMGKMLEGNLAGSQFKFYPDPYPQQQLFYRSDNATLAMLGVPAHTISTSKMDSEKYYHTQDDEIETLDMNNMAEIIKAIAVSSSSIIAGTDTPSRVDTKQLR